MSKPNKPGELRDVTVDAISLVSKAANKERFKIFKSETEEPKQEQQAPEVINKEDNRGLEHVLKDNFKEEQSEKAEETTEINKEKLEKTIQLNEMFYALKKDIGLLDEKKTELSATADIEKSVDEFRDVALSVLIGKEEVEKSGRKISSSRLTKLRSIQSMLNEVLSGIDDNEEVKELTTEEITKAVEEAIKPLNERIEKLEAPAQEEPKPEAQTPTEPPVADVVKDAITEAMKPLLARVEKIENARGFSNRVPEETRVEKNEDIWAGIF